MHATEPSALAWHYTTGEKWTHIRWLGELLPARIGIKPPERPIVWFSMDQRFEPTARKAIADSQGRVLRLAEPEELDELAGGAFRIGIHPARLLRGEALRKAARMPPNIWRRLGDEGRRQGADPALWLGAVVEALPLTGLRVERLTPAGAWCALHEAQAAELPPE